MKPTRHPSPVSAVFGNVHELIYDISAGVKAINAARDEILEDFESEKERVPPACVREAAELIKRELTARYVALQSGG